MIWAADDGQANMVKILLEKGANVNAADNDGWTALMLASQGGHVDVVKALLDAGADVNAKKADTYSFPLILRLIPITALSLARSNRHHAVVKLLKAAKTRK